MSFRDYMTGNMSAIARGLKALDSKVETEYLTKISFQADYELQTNFAMKLCINATMLGVRRTCSLGPSPPGPTFC